MNLFPPDILERGLSGLGLAGADKPNTADMIRAAGYSLNPNDANYIYEQPNGQELINVINRALYGDIGANLDTRNWDAIMKSSDPLKAAQDALADMYSDPAYLAKNLENVVQQGYTVKAADVTYKQMESRVGSTYTDTYLKTDTAQKVIKSLREDVINAFLNTPGANPEPDEDAINYYIYEGIDKLKADVAAITASNPALAAKIDARRRELKLPPYGVDAVQPPAPVVQPPAPVVRPPVEVVCPPGFRYEASVQSCIRSAIFPPAPVVQPPSPVFPNPDQPLQPIYTKQYPLPTINRAAKGFLVGKGRDDDAPITQPFDLKAGDPIPANWQEDYAFSTQPDTGLPTTPAPVTPTPTQPGAAAGIAPLLLAAAAAYFLGS